PKIGSVNRILPTFLHVHPVFPLKVRPPAMLQAINRVFSRILVLVLLALGALVAVGLFVINESRNNLYEQKKSDIRHVAENAMTLVADYDKRASAGAMSREQAQAEAKKAINA